MNRKTILMSPADSKIYNFFEGLYNVISTEPIDDFIGFERLHADMQMLNIKENLFVNSNCQKLISKLKSLDTQFTLCENIGCKYPENVALNAALIGDKLFCKEKALHPKVKEFCETIDIKIINVKQGYTKCSTLVLNSNTIITDDESIAKAALINNINTLLISKGDIYLDAQNVGFIGGASAKIGETIYFFGDIDTHKDAVKIKNYIYNAGLSYKSVSSEKLIDIGGIVIID